MARDDSVLLTKYCSQEGWFRQKNNNRWGESWKRGMLGLEEAERGKRDRGMDENTLGALGEVWPDVDAESNGIGCGYVN